MTDDEIEFPQVVCINSQPHGPHRIAGTWRAECPGYVPRPETDAERREIDAWIEDQVSRLSEAELLRVQDFIRRLDQSRQ